MKLTYEKHTFEFIKPAQTSRGSYTKKDHYLITLELDGKKGTGEAAALPDLSIDGQKDLESKLIELQKKHAGDSELSFWMSDLEAYPTLQFALECAYKDLQSRNGIIFRSDFTNGKEGIPINGLVWMDTVDNMYRQAELKINEGYNCIKFKVGALDHKEECKLIERVRELRSSSQLEIRIDANGAYDPKDALKKIRDFSRFDIHSIEQPIKAGNLKECKRICAESEIPVALDEELIGIDVYKKGEALLKEISPAFIVIKPTLLGGLKNADQWIRIAENLDIEWWCTSALEGNIALSHIAQWLSTKDNYLDQGLGTGGLYKNNFPSRLKLMNGNLYFLRD